MKNDIPDSNDDFLKDINSYEGAVQYISNIIDSYLAEFEEVPSEDEMEELLDPVAKKYNKPFEQVADDVGNYKINKSYNDYIVKYATALYKKTLKYLGSKKDIVTKAVFPKIDPSHVLQISKMFNLNKNTVLTDIETEFLKIRDHAGVNENLKINEGPANIAKSVYQYGIDRGISPDRDGNSMIMRVMPTIRQMRVLQNEKGEFEVGDGYFKTLVQFERDPHNRAYIKFTWSF